VISGWGRKFLSRHPIAPSATDFGARMRIRRKVIAFPEHFPEKWEPFFRRKCDKSKT
jgi:hypothetical protein